MWILLQTSRKRKAPGSVIGQVLNVQEDEDSDEPSSFGKKVASTVLPQRRFANFPHSMNSYILPHLTWAQFHDSAYRKHRIGVYGSREFCAYGKRISRVSGKFRLVRVRTPRY